MKNLKIGIFGVSRGMDMVNDFLLNGCDVVAVCDFRKSECGAAVKKLGESVTVYDDFDKFIEHDMDAVVLSNYFHEHAPYAIKCFERGIHVYSECISNGTMAEGVALIRAFEKSNSIYMLAENYPFMTFNREIKRVCDNGTLGKILFAEGEYNHPVSAVDADFMKKYRYFEGHWRNYLPRAYYTTHSLAPVMRATGATPKRVTAFCVFEPFSSDEPSASYVGDRAAIITTQNDDGSIFRVTGCAAFGAHENSYRVCGVNGQMENVRGTDKVMLRYSPWAVPEGLEENNFYEPSLNDRDEDIIKKAGHGGGDYLAVRTFVDCVRSEKQPEMPFDIYSAVNMSSVAILSHRSILEGGKPYDIPDFKTEAARKLYENDRLTPFYGDDGSKPSVPCCSHPDFKPTEKQLELYKELLK